MHCMESAGEARPAAGRTRRRPPFAESTIPPGPFSIRLFETRSKGFDYSWHLHSALELTAIVAGSGHRVVGEDISVFSPGDLVLIGPDVPHTYVTPTAAEAVAVVAHFGSLFLEHLLPELNETRRFLESVGAIHVTGTAAHDVAAELVAGNEDPDPGRRVLMLASVLHRIAGDPSIEHRRLSAAPIPDDRWAASPLEDVLRIIHAESADAVVQSSVAARVGLTPAALARLMRKATGRTFTEYLRETRITEACRLLAETDESVTRIAFSVGFSNLSNFYRSFRRLKGMTPRAYRVMVRP